MLSKEEASVLLPNTIVRRHQLRLTEGDVGSLSQQDKSNVDREMEPQVEPAKLNGNPLKPEERFNTKDCCMMDISHKQK